MSSKENKNSVFTKMLINQNIALEFKYVNRLLSDNLLEYLKKKFEGKCCEQGYIKPDTIKIVNYSSGVVKNNFVVFSTVFECLVCYLVEGIEINCIAKNITKAGIRCELDMEKTPAVIFVARDHHYTNKTFSEVQEGSSITVKIIGQRYELNDTNISAIAELVKVNKTSKKLQIESITSDGEETIKKSFEDNKIEELEPDKVTSEKKDDEEDLKEDDEEDLKEDDKDDVKELETDKVSSEKEDSKKIVQEEPETEQSISEKSNDAEETKVAEKTLQSVEDENDDIHEAEAIKALEKLEKESQALKDKEVTIVEDTEPPKRKRGRPKKIK